MPGTHLTAHDLLRDSDHAGAGRPRQQSVDFLRDLLAAGPVSATDVRAAAEQAGLAWRTVQRATQDVGITKTKNGFDAGWTWSLAAPATAGPSTLEPEGCHEDHDTGMWRSSPFPPHERTKRLTVEPAP